MNWLSACAVLLCGCVAEQSTGPWTLDGHWRAVATLPGGELPSGVEFAARDDGSCRATLRNGDERRLIAGASDVNADFAGTWAVTFTDDNGIVTQAVGRIHTGFNGSGTGVHYDEFRAEFTAFIDQLLSEEEA